MHILNVWGGGYESCCAERSWCRTYYYGSCSGKPGSHWLVIQVLAPNGQGPSAFYTSVLGSKVHSQV